MENLLFSIDICTKFKFIKNYLIEKLIFSINKILIFSTIFLFEPDHTSGQPASHGSPIVYCIVLILCTINAIRVLGNFLGNFENG